MFGRTTETVEAPALTADILDAWAEALRVIDAWSVERRRAWGEGRAPNPETALAGVLRERPHLRDAVVALLQAGR